jgi:hypothetical protein
MGATEIARAVGCKRGNVRKKLKAAGLSCADRVVCVRLARGTVAEAQSLELRILLQAD